MNKSQFTKTRNWLKRRLMGFKFDKSTLTEKEKSRLIIIENNINVLLDEWDRESIKLGLSPLPTYEIRNEYHNFTTKNMKIVKEARINGDTVIKLQN